MNENDEPTSQNNLDRNTFKGFMDYVEGYREWLRANQRVDEKVKKSKGWIIDMLTNPNLSHAWENNPPSYPKVPSYVQPQWRSYSSDEIERIRTKSLRKHVLENILTMTDVPMDAKELYKKIKIVTSIHPNIAWEVSMHEGVESISTWIKQGSRKSLRVFQKNILHYNISLVTNPETNDPIISTIFVEKTPDSIGIALKRLREMTVANTREKDMIESILNETLWAIRNK